MTDIRILRINDTCTGCGACASICPSKCISIKRDDEGFYYPTCEMIKCIGCHLCEKTCHILSGDNHPIATEKDFFMYADNDIVRTKSSSGGAFYRLAQKTLSKDGVVFGSAYNQTKSRVEIVNTEDVDLELIQKSKYVESFTGVAFTKIANELLAKRNVLFCGTPCQVRGLKKYLMVNRVDDANLITVDFICHGVPSSQCFDEYIKRFQKKSKRITNVDFRNKRFDKNGQKWHDLSLRVDFEDNTSRVIPYEPPYNLDYYKLFEDSVILRKCCFKCDIPRQSSADFTLADFWGVYKYRPSIDDNKGLSIIKIHTLKGKHYWDDIKHDAPICEALPFDAVKYIYYKSDRTIQRARRDMFFDNYMSMGYKRAINKLYGLRGLLKAYTADFLKTKVKMIIRRY